MSSINVCVLGWQMYPSIGCYNLRDFYSIETSRTHSCCAERHKNNSPSSVCLVKCFPYLDIFKMCGLQFPGFPSLTNTINRLIRALVISLLFGFKNETVFMEKGAVLQTVIGIIQENGLFHPPTAHLKVEPNQGSDTQKVAASCLTHEFACKNSSVNSALQRPP